MQLLNTTSILPLHTQLVIWKRFIRILKVGRHLFASAGIGIGLCTWIVLTKISGVQNDSTILSVMLYNLGLCWSAGLALFALLDARSRFQDYKRAKDLFYENGFKPRIAKLYTHSKCQRDAIRVAAKDLGLLKQLDHFYFNQGYRWYHIFPDFLSKRPWLLLSKRYWQKTLFEPRYASNYFFW